MKRIVLGVSSLLILATSISAQVSPTPVINNEMRDISSTRRRALELERVKREADKPNFREFSKEQPVKFAEIKEDFENIQKLEYEIVQTYKSGKQVNFKKISDLASELLKKAARLDFNLFIPKSKNQEKSETKDTIEPKNVRDLIIELDSKIGSFVQSQIFTNNKIVDSKISEKSQTDLEKIIKISEILSEKARQVQ